MKTLLGLLLIVAGIVLGVYVGFWVLLVGGVVGIIQHLKSTETISVVVIALNILKIILASFVGWLIFTVLFLSGVRFLKAK